MKWGCFYLLIVLGGLCKAQTLAKLDMGVDKGNVYAIANENQLSCVLIDPRTAHLFVYDSLLSLVKNKDFDLYDVISKMDGVTGVTQLNNNPVLFFTDSKMRKFTYVIFNTDSLTIEKGNLPEEDKQHKYIGSFSVTRKAG